MQITDENTQPRHRGKALVWKSYFYGYEGHCPSCNRLICYDYDMPPNFCPHCGQAIKGGKVERKK